MTIEEKKIRIIKHCLRSECRSCALFKVIGYNPCHKPGADIERNYEILFGGSEKVEPETEPEKETVNHPAHYQGKHECIDEMIALFGVEAVKHFCMCNVYKYRFRAANKNGQEDLDKADWYMDKLMELEEQHD